MVNWKEVKGLEKSIILATHKHPKSISKISKELDKSMQIMGKTIERMQKQDLIVKIHQYQTDARKTEIQINKRRVRIEKSHTFYLKYYFLIIIFLVFSGVMAKILENFFFFLGSVIIALPLFLMMLYDVHTRENTIIVEKNPKITEKEKKLEETEKVDNVD